MFSDSDFSISKLIISQEIFQRKPKTEKNAACMSIQEAPDEKYNGLINSFHLWNIKTAPVIWKQ